VYANPACPAGDACDVLELLHGPERIGLRLLMLLLSYQRWTPTAIAELLGCDQTTVRRWIHRYNTHGVSGLGDRPRSGRPSGQPAPWRADPAAAHYTQGVDHRAAVVGAWSMFTTAAPYSSPWLPEGYGQNSRQAA
jgi:Winged helix-turn helix